MSDSDKIAAWENALLDRHLRSLEGDPCEDCDDTGTVPNGSGSVDVCHCQEDVEWEPDPDRFRDDPDYAPYYVYIEDEPAQAYPQERPFYE